MTELLFSAQSMATNSTTNWQRSRLEFKAECYIQNGAMVEIFTGFGIVRAFKKKKKTLPSAKMPQRRIRNPVNMQRCKDKTQMNNKASMSE